MRDGLALSVHGLTKRFGDRVAFQVWGIPLGVNSIGGLRSRLGVNLGAGPVGPLTVDCRGVGARSTCMLLSLTYQLVLFVVELVLVRTRSDAQLRAEVLALRQQAIGIHSPGSR